MRKTRGHDRHLDESAAAVLVCALISPEAAARSSSASITYVTSATARTDQWQRSIIVVLQVFTVLLALRVAGARRVVPTIAAIALAYAVVVAVVALFSDEPDLTTGPHRERRATSSHRSRSCDRS